MISSYLQLDKAKHGDPSTFSSRYYENYVSVDNNSVWRILSPEESIVLSNE